jgi:hypothetical protein
MPKSQVLRNVFLTLSAAGLLTAAGCSNQAPNQATNRPPAPQKKTAAAKPAASKATPAKPASSKADTGKTVAAKGAAAKPVAVSSKVTPATTLVTLPKGTAISATVGQTLASNKNHSGDSFAATLSAPVKLDGKTVIPKGTHITGRVVTAKKSGPAELTVALSTVSVNGKSYKLVSDPIDRTAKSPAKSADDTEASAAKGKDVTLSAQSHLKFKLAKPAKIPVAAKG